MLAIVSGLFSGASSGIFAVSGLDIQKDYNIQESDFGLLLSSGMIGNIIGTLISPYLFKRIHVKYIIFTGVALGGVCILVFPLTSNYAVLLISMILRGIFSVMDDQM